MSNILNTFNTGQGRVVTRKYLSDVAKILDFCENRSIRQPRLQRLLRHKLFYPHHFFKYINELVAAGLLQQQAATQKWRLHTTPCGLARLRSIQFFLLTQEATCV